LGGLIRLKIKKCKNKYKNNNKSNFWNFDSATRDEKIMKQTQKKSVTNPKST
jgi:hypothetical protein